MKIAIDISQIVHEGTGVATYTQNLVTELLKLNQKGKRSHQFLLFGTSLRKKTVLDEFAASLRKEQLDFETNFFLLPPTFTATIWNQIHHVRIERLIGKIDLFHSSDWTQPPTRAKKVTTIHDLVIFKHPEYSHPKIIETQKERLKWVVKECDKVIVDSLQTKKDCEKFLKIPAKEIAVIYLAAGNAVTDFAKLTSAEKSKLVSRARGKFKLSRPYIVAIGTREPRKNLERLIEVASNLTVDLVIIGKFGWGKEVKELPENVKLLGFVPEGDLQPLLSGAVAYVHPSFYEGFGVTVLEAMTLGVPVVTSRLSSLPEVGGEAALYVDPERVQDIRSKINQVISLSPKERTELVKKSLEQAEKFSWEKTARETMQVYEELAR